MREPPPNLWKRRWYWDTAPCLIAATWTVGSASGPLTAALLGARWGGEEAMLPPGPAAAWAVAHGSRATEFVMLGGMPREEGFLTDEP
jgi:hypothetical protein